jgi:hypothetical protein
MKQKANRAQLSLKINLFIATAVRTSDLRGNPTGCHSARKKELTLQIKTNQGCGFFRFLYSREYKQLFSLQEKQNWKANVHPFVCPKLHDMVTLKATTLISAVVKRSSTKFVK